MRTSRSPSTCPRRRRAAETTAVYFPGSTIGNFTAAAARELLGTVHGEVGPGGLLLIGVDLVKDRDVLERAYDDAAGVTADFNLNLLVRMNRELGADFDLQAFAHRARWVEPEGRIEMHLESLRAQTARLGGEAIAFAAGETICTEHSHKYTLEGFAAIAQEAGFAVEQVWTDDDQLFSVQALRARAG